MNQPLTLVGGPTDPEYVNGLMAQVDEEVEWASNLGIRSKSITAVVGDKTHRLRKQTNSLALAAIKIFLKKISCCKLDQIR